MNPWFMHQFVQVYLSRKPEGSWSRLYCNELARLLKKDDNRPDTKSITPLRHCPENSAGTGRKQQATTSTSGSVQAH
jgi:hypothetical protein